MALPLIPAVLLAAGTGLVAYEAWLKKKPAVPGTTPAATSPTSTSKPSSSKPSSPTVAPGAEPYIAELQAAYNELLAASDGADPDALEALAYDLETYGLTVEAAKLRAKAAEIRARRAQPGVTVIPPTVPSFPTSTPGVPTNAGQTATVVTVSDPLTLRAAPNGSEVGKLPKGATVTVLNWDGGGPTSNAPQGWALVTYADKMGYASKQYLQLGGGAAPSASTPPPGPATLQTAVVTTAKDPLTLRATPNGSEVGKLPKGSTVIVLDWSASGPTSNSSQGWARVGYAGKTGYASKNYLTLTSQVTTSGVPKASDGKLRPVTCLAPQGCRIRATPSPNGKALAVLPNGETASLVRHVSGAKGSAASPGPGGWCLVRWANFQGWVPSEWMRLS